MPSPAISQIQSLNRYAYAGNNPTTFTDPSGLDACTPGAQCVTVYGGTPPDIQILPCSFLAIAEAACYGGSSPAPPGWSMWSPGGNSGGGGGGGGGGSAPPPKPAPLSGPQTPTWWLQTKVFVPTLGQNFVDEFTPNGCFAQFANELVTGQSADASPPGAGPEDVIRTVGQAGAASYVVTQGLSYPLKSSIYRGILGLTETAAGIVTLAPLDYEAGKAFVHEMQSLGAGTCQ